MIRLLLAGAFLLLSWSSAEAVTRLTTSVARGGVASGTCLVTRCTNAYAIGLSSGGDVVSMEGNTISSPYVYAHVNDMIQPTANKGGTSDTNRITVLCEVDGGCLLDGTFTNIPVRFNSNNDWWYLKGFNAKRGAPQVMKFFAGSDDNLIERVVAWDGQAHANALTIQADDSDRNTFIDVAAFGVGRKVFGPGTNGTGTKVRRGWFRWEGSLGGSNGGVTISYKATGVTYENVLVTFSGLSMPQNGTFTDGTGSYTNYAYPMGGSILYNDRLETTSTPKVGNITLRGVGVYLPQDAVLPNTTTLRMIDFMGTSSITATDLFAAMHPSHLKFNDVLGITLRRRVHNCPGLSATLSAGAGCLVNGVVTPDHANFRVQNNSATRVTSIRGTKQRGSLVGDSFGTQNLSGFANETDWTVDNTKTGLSLAALGGYTPWNNTNTDGIRLCHPITDGVVDTSTGLWPWPMEDRIAAATGQAGTFDMVAGCPGCTYSGTGPVARTSISVTAQIETVLGTIPAGSCRSGAAQTFPDSTGFPPATLSTF